jgi:GH24 family phage-related lysozyme (muramidase)
MAAELSNAMSRTKGFEGGHKSQAYLDSLGFPTYGTGKVLEHSKYDTLPDKYSNMNLSEQEGDIMFHEDYNKKMSEVESLYGEKWGNLPKEAQNVMTDMAYNVGSQGLFKKFPGMIKDIQSGNYANAAKQLKYKDISKGDMEENVSDWWNQVGGSNTEKENLIRAGNRATSNYDVLSGLGNNLETQPVDDVMAGYNKVEDAFTS